MKQPMYPFEAYICKDNESIHWEAKSKILKGCVGQGNTALDAIREMAENERVWIETAYAYSIAVPEAPIVSSDDVQMDKTKSSTLPLVYKAVTTVMQYDEENKILYGKLENAPGELYYYGNDVDEAIAAFHKKVDEYYESL